MAGPYGPRRSPTRRPLDVVIDPLDPFATPPEGCSDLSHVVADASQSVADPLKPIGDLSGGVPGRLQGLGDLFESFAISPEQWADLLQGVRDLLKEVCNRRLVVAGRLRGVGDRFGSVRDRSGGFMDLTGAVFGGFGPISDRSQPIADLLKPVGNRFGACSRAVNRFRISVNGSPTTPACSVSSRRCRRYRRYRRRCWSTDVSFSAGRCDESPAAELLCSTIFTPLHNPVAATVLTRARSPRSMSNTPKTSQFSRRSFLRGGTCVGTGLVLHLAGCGETMQPQAGNATKDAEEGSSPGASSTTVDAETQGSTGQSAAGAEAASALGAADILFGLYQGDAGNAVRSAAAKLDFSWLKSGDSVLIKVASNSGDPHPAVTSPAAVKAMVAELKQRGAGRVVVADQAGVEWVRLSAQGRYSSTREQWASNGLLAAEGDAEVYFFDDQGFGAGYFQATLPSGHHWPRGAWLSNVIKQVDHVIYMPRLGAHQLAGLSMGLKIAVGWLRDDSRHDLHKDARYFHAKYTELTFADELRSRLRLIVTACDKALLHGGPDTGTIYDLDPAIVIASANIANHDAVACSTMVTLEKAVASTAGPTTYIAATAAMSNTFFANGLLVSHGAAGRWVSSAPTSLLVVDAFDRSVDGCAAVARAWQLSGGAPSAVRVVLDGQPIDSSLRDGIQAHGKTLYSFV